MGGRGEGSGGRIRNRVSRGGGRRDGGGSSVQAKEQRKGRARRE